MISDDRMLNTATRIMIDKTTNMVTRSTASASNRLAFICRQSVTTALPATLSANGASISPTLSASTVWTSIMLTTSSSSNRSEEHTSELQSLMRISYAVFCLKKKKATTDSHKTSIHN